MYMELTTLLTLHVFDVSLSMVICKVFSTYHKFQNTPYLKAPHGMKQMSGNFLEDVIILSLVARN